MVKYSAAVVLGCLYVLCASWVIRNEGMSYRQSLKRARLTAQESARPVPRLSEEGENREAMAPVAVAQKRPSAPPTSQASVAKVRPKPRPSPAAKPAPASIAAVVPEPKPVAPPPIAPAPAHRPANANEPPLAAPDKDPFWDAPALKDVRDLSDLKPEDEEPPSVLSSTM